MNKSSWIGYAIHSASCCNSWPCWQALFGTCNKRKAAAILRFFLALHWMRAKWSIAGCWRRPDAFGWRSGMLTCMMNFFLRGTRERKLFTGQHFRLQVHVAGLQRRNWQHWFGWRALFVSNSKWSPPFQGSKVLIKKAWGVRHFHPSWWTVPQYAPSVEAPHSLCPFGLIWLYAG